MTPSFAVARSRQLQVLPRLPSLLLLLLLQQLLSSAWM
jgi:hypothetical protein